MVPDFKTNYILVDYENVQPKNLELLQEDHFKVFIFVGAKQLSIRFDVVDQLQKLGSEKGKYIKVSGIQKDALDFHIAYYIGKLAATDADAWFHIISKDKGFDPLIQHLKESGVRVARRELITDIPLFRISNKASGTEKLDAVVANLKGRGLSKPRKQQTLANTINSIFKEPLTEPQLKKLIDQLKGRKYITIKTGNVTYNLPK